MRVLLIPAIVLRQQQTLLDDQTKHEIHKQESPETDQHRSRNTLIFFCFCALIPVCNFVCFYKLLHTVFFECPSLTYFVLLLSWPCDAVQR